MVREMLKPLVPERTRAARASYEDWQQPRPAPGHVNMSEIILWLRDHLPRDAVLTNGAGNFTVWPNKFFKFGPRARLLAPQSGAMGYGLPAALRITVGDQDGVSRVLDCLGRFMSERGRA